MRRAVFLSAAIRSAPPRTAPAARRRAPRQAGELGMSGCLGAARRTWGERSERGRSFAVVERLGVESTAFSARKGFPRPNRAAPLKAIYTAQAARETGRTMPRRWDRRSQPEQESRESAFRRTTGTYGQHDARHAWTSLSCLVRRRPRPFRDGGAAGIRLRQRSRLFDAFGDAGRGRRVRSERTSVAATRPARRNPFGRPLRFGGGLAPCVGAVVADGPAVVAHYPQGPRNCSPAKTSGAASRVSGQLSLSIRRRWRAGRGSPSQPICSM